MSLGLIIGKFDPPHRGHSMLIDIAVAQVDRLVVLVWDFPAQTIPSEKRAAWLREIHPDIDVLVAPDSNPESPFDTKECADQIALTVKAKIDVLFSSESYAEQVAHYLGARHVSVDRDRRWVPCTGTMIRRAPLDNLRWLEPCVRAHYVKRVCVAGAESTGKTTLCEVLAQRFVTTVVPEYGREYSITKFEQGELGRWRSDEFLHIAREQQRLEDEAARTANRLLLCDTDTLATRIWHERYLNAEPAAWPVPPSAISMYLLPYPDVPFVPDEIRDSEHKRFWMFERFVTECERSGIPCIILRGEWEERRVAAIEAVESLMGSTKPQQSS